jgi:membrane-associated PAP2 superfamily phosphatase
LCERLCTIESSGKINWRIEKTFSSYCFLTPLFLCLSGSQVSKASAGALEVSNVFQTHNMAKFLKVQSSLISFFTHKRKKKIFLVVGFWLLKELLFSRAAAKQREWVDCGGSEP